MTIDIVASKEKAATGRGANQDQGPSSVYAKELPPIAGAGVANPDPALIAKRGMTAQDTVGFVTKPVAAAPSHHPALPPRKSSSGSPGGHIGAPTRPVTTRR